MGSCADQLSREPDRVGDSVMTEFGVGWKVRGFRGSAERAGGGEEPVEGAAEVGGRRPGPERVEVALDVVDRAREDVELVVQLVEARLRDDQLALAELELVGPLAGDPVPLAAAARAELLGAAPTTALGEDPPAPPAAPRFPS